MTDMSTKVLKGYKGDASVLKPTMMCAVPLIMDRYLNTKFNSSSTMLLPFHFSFLYRSKLTPVTRRIFIVVLTRLFQLKCLRKIRSNYIPKINNFRSYKISVFLLRHFIFQNIQKYHRFCAKEEYSCAKNVSNLLQLQALLDETRIHHSDLRQNHF